MGFPWFLAEGTLVDFRQQPANFFFEAKGAFVWCRCVAFIHLDFLRRLMGRANAHVKEIMAPHARI